ncbi:hypothetical protein [Streptomyces sp. NPDC090021]|uniref:hypothetical protein n=1 Tax=Streptomyces sp. NPDC090021 TaxID=3365919 RepID=UPI0037F558B6
MGNSVACPVLRTADPAEAYEKARHLCALPATRYAQVYVGAELRTVAAVGAGPASVRWEGCRPDEPEPGSYSSPAYDGVQLVLNSDRCDWSEQVAGVHTLHVHATKHGDPGRAERLAAAIGGAVPGAPEQG